MTPAEIIGSLRRRGVLLVPARDGRLRFQPREALSEKECALLARHRDAILALLDADPIGWRAAVMVIQRPRSGIPLLLARPGIRFPLGSCCSCGDPLEPHDRYRCAACVAATVAVLASIR